MEIRDAKDEPDRLVADLRDESELRHDELLQLFRQELEFLLRKGDETPVLLPSVVVDFPEASGFCAEILQVALTNTGGVTSSERGGEAAQAGRGAGRFSKPPGVEIHHFVKPESFDERCGS